MHYLQRCICALLLLIIPITLPAQESLSQEQVIRDLKLPTYNEILDLLDQIESGELEGRCNASDLEKIDRFLVMLAVEGAEVLGTQPEDILMPTTCLGDVKIRLCKGWWQRSWENTKSFVSTYKTEIIIGAAVVVGVVTVGVAAAAVATALLVPDEQIKETVRAQAEPLKEIAVKEPEALREKAQQLGSTIAHETFYHMSRAGSTVQDELRTVASMVLPKELLEINNAPILTTKENYEQSVAAGHEKIDEAFSTDQAYCYKPEYKAMEESFITRMEIPLPPFGAPSSGLSSLGRAARVGEEVATIAREAEIASVARAEALVEEAGWSLPKNGGGGYINGRWYTEHALERMAPETPEVMAELEVRALKRAQAEGLEPATDKFGEWWDMNGPDPRGVPPSVIEAEITNPGSTNVKVILNENGDVVTVIPRGNNK